MIVAFLQNQWFRDPERMRKLEARMGRERFIRTFLFWSCLTGKRIKKAFGEDLVDVIVWEESSREMGGAASSVFKPDLAHIQEVLDRHKPNVVLAFGRVAGPPLEKLKASGACWSLVSGPHPAARGAGTCAELNRMAAELRALVSRTLVGPELEGGLVVGDGEDPGNVAGV